jgi:hypothetical protein
VAVEGHGVLLEIGRISAVLANDIDFISEAPGLPKSSHREILPTMGSYLCAVGDVVAHNR